jgi:hypothetical protein
LNLTGRSFDDKEGITEEMNATELFWQNSSKHPSRNGRSAWIWLMHLKTTLKGIHSGRMLLGQTELSDRSLHIFFLGCIQLLCYTNTGQL